MYGICLRPSAVDVAKSPVSLALSMSYNPCDCVKALLNAKSSAAAIESSTLPYKLLPPVEPNMPLAFKAVIVSSLKVSASPARKAAF